MDKEMWEGKHYSFYQNKKCEFFPCHNTDNAEEFNCLFCYCPLYALGDQCGGNFRIGANKIKDCGHCMIPHVKGNYGHVLDKFQDIVEITKKGMK